MIEGVRTKKLRVVPDDRGRLAEMLRSDDDLFMKFGQCYMTTTYPGVVKAWHYHKIQTDNFVVITGMFRVALYDTREESPTRNEINDFYIGDHNPMLLQIPPGVYHGWKNIGEQEGIVVNISTELYNYDEPDEYRLPFDTEEIPYNWETRMG